MKNSTKHILLFILSILPLVLNSCASTENNLCTDDIITCLTPDPSQIGIDGYTCEDASSYAQEAKRHGLPLSHTVLSGERTIYVDSAMANSSWIDLILQTEEAHVAPTISTALSLAARGDKIVVCPGLYQEGISIEAIHDGIQIVNMADGSSYESELSEYTLIDGSNILNLGSVVSIEDAAEVTLRGFTIKNGTATNGGGIYASLNSNSTDYENILYLENLIIKKNMALLGGGLYVEGRGDVLAEQMTFSNNQAGSGGGVYVDHTSSVTKKFNCNECKFSENQASLTGSAINISGKDELVLSNSNLTINSSQPEGLDPGTIYLGWQASFEGTNLNWYTDDEENLGSDIVNSSEVYEASVASFSEPLTQLQSILSQLENIVTAIEAENYDQAQTYLDELNTKLNELKNTLQDLGFSEADIETLFTDMESTLEELQALIDSEGNTRSTRSYRSGLQKRGFNFDPDNTGPLISKGDRLGNNNGSNNNSDPSPSDSLQDFLASVMENFVQSLISSLIDNLTMGYLEDTLSSWLGGESADSSFDFRTPLDKLLSEIEDYLESEGIDFNYELDEENIDTVEEAIDDLIDHITSLGLDNDTLLGLLAHLMGDQFDLFTSTYSESNLTELLEELQTHLENQEYDQALELIEDFQGGLLEAFSYFEGRYNYEGVNSVKCNLSSDGSYSCITL